MECWVVGDDRELSGRIRKSLQHLNQRCQEAHVISLADAARIPQLSEAVNCIVFIALPTVRDEDVETIRTIRTVSQFRMILVSSTADNASVVNAIRAGVSDFVDKDHFAAWGLAGCLIKRGTGKRPTQSNTLDCTSRFPVRATR